MVCICLHSWFCDCFLASNIYNATVWKFNIELQNGEQFQYASVKCLLLVQWESNQFHILFIHHAITLQSACSKQNEVNCPVGDHLIYGRHFSIHKLIMICCEEERMTNQTKAILAGTATTSLCKQQHWSIIYISLYKSKNFHFKKQKYIFFASKWNHCN